MCHSKHVSRSTPSGIQCKAVALLKLTQRQRGWILNSEHAFTILNSLQRLRPKYLFWMESQGDGTSSSARQRLCSRIIWTQLSWKPCLAELYPFTLGTMFTQSFSPYSCQNHIKNCCIWSDNLYIQVRVRWLLWKPPGNRPCCTILCCYSCGR